MPNAHAKSKEITVKDANAELLVAELKAYLTKNYPKLIKKGDIIDFIYRPASNGMTGFSFPATLTINNPSVYEAYEKFIQLPATVFKLKPIVVNIGYDVDADLVISELKAYLTKNHTELIKDGKMVDLVYSPKAKLMGFHFPASLTISNPAVHEAYKQFMQLPATVFKLKPKVVQIGRDVDADLVVSELKAYLTKNHPDLIKNGEMVDLIYSPAEKGKHTGWSFPASLTISNPAVHEAYEKFKALPHIAFMLNPKEFTLSKEVDSDSLVSQFKTYLTKNHAALIKKGEIVGFTYTAYDNQSTITIGDKLVYDAFTEFNKQQFALKKDKVQQQFIGQLGELNTKLNSFFAKDSDRSKERENVYRDLMSIQKEFFEKITHDLNPATIQNHIESFQIACNERAHVADKLMGPGWLSPAVEVVVKAVVGLFVGIGMVVGVIFGQGLAKEKHREKYHDTFFKWNETESQKTFSQFKQKSTETLSELKKDSNESTDSERFKPS